SLRRRAHWPRAFLPGASERSIENLPQLVRPRVQQLKRIYFLGRDADFARPDEGTTTLSQTSRVRLYRRRPIARYEPHFGLRKDPVVCLFLTLSVSIRSEEH